MTTLYLVNCSMPIWSGGSWYSPSGYCNISNLYTSKTEALDSLTFLHDKICNEYSFDTSFDKLNEICCKECKFKQFAFFTNSDRDYCEKCQIEENKIFEENKLSLSCLYCKKCTYEKINDFKYKRFFCEKCTEKLNANICSSCGNCIDIGKSIYIYSEKSYICCNIIQPNENGEIYNKYEWNI